MKQFSGILRVLWLVVAFVIAGICRGEAAVSPPKWLVSQQENSSIRLYWESLTDSSVTGYAIYRSSDGVAYAKIATAPPYPSSSIADYPDAAVTASGTYWYKVAPIGTGGLEESQSLPTATTMHGIVKTSFTSGSPAPAVVGDFNGDGTPDVALGFTSGKNLGVKIYYGGGRRTTVNVTLPGLPNSGFGQALAVADLNRDGFDDLIVGEPNHVDPADIAGYFGGKVHVFLGSTSFATTPALTIKGKRSFGCNWSCYYAAQGERLGYSLATIGDMNNDGYPDVAIGAPDGGLEYSGGVYVLYGGNPLTERTQGFIGPVWGQHMGKVVRAIGDANGDSYPDLLVSASSPSGAYLTKGGQNPSLETIFFPGGNYIGGGDLTGDGYGDILVSRQAEYNIVDLYQGSSSLNNSPDSAFSIPIPNSIYSLGDVDGDGRSDIVSGLTVIFGYAGLPRPPTISTTGLNVIGVGDQNKDGIAEFFANDTSTTYLCSLSGYANLPSITINSLSTVTTNNSSYQLSGKITGTATKLLIGGQQVSIYGDGTFQSTLDLVSGNNFIELIAVATDGRVAKKSIVVTYTPPSITITSPANNAVLAANPVTVTGTLNDPSVQVLVNNMPAVVAGTSFQATIYLVDGENSITAVAFKEGKQVAAHSVNITLLTKGGVSGVVTEAPNGTPLSGVAVTVTDGAWVQTAITDTAGKYSFYGLDVGNVTITIAKPGYITQTLNASSVLGQMTTVSAQLVPIPPLTITIASPANGATLTTSPVTVSGTVTNNAQVTVNGVSTAVIDGSFSVNTALLGGNNTITTSATDPYGQTAQDSRTVVLDVPHRIFVSPNTLDFGPLYVQKRSSRTVTVTNVSSTDLRLGSVSRSADPFWTIADDCSGRTLAPAATCSLQVLYAPTAEGTFTGEIAIPSDDVYYPSVKVSLAGMAAAFTGYYLPDTGLETKPINPMQFTVNSTVVATDENTGLMWQRGSASPRTWNDAAAYCQNLSLDSLSGWRLPAFAELMTIVDYARSQPAIRPEIFTDTVADNYWSFTSQTIPAAYAVNFAYGEARQLAKTEAANVRCVKGVELRQKGTVTSVLGTIIHDLDSGLMWSNPPTNASDPLYTWDTLHAVEAYTFGDFSDWRMPTAKEFASLPPIACSGAADCYFWSATPSLRPDANGQQTQAFAYDVSTIVSDAKSVVHAQRLVRSGNKKPQDAWTVSATPAAIDFGSTEIGRKPSATVNVANTGTGNLVIDNFTPLSGPYVLLSDGCSGRTLAAGAACPITVQFNPSQPGTFYSTLAIPSNDADLPSMSLNMIGTAAISGTSLSGRITNQESQLPLESCTVSLIDSAAQTHTTLTDAAGSYVLNDFVSGSFTGAITKPGFADYLFAGTIAPQQSLTISAALTPVAPVIGAVQVSPITATTATISWTTDQPASSLVEFGETTAYGGALTDAALVTIHSQALSGLQPGMTYHYRITVTVANGQTATSGDGTFVVPLFSVKHQGDAGAVAIMTAEGNYDYRKPDASINDTARQAVAREYIRTHGDSFDSLVILSTFDYAMPQAGAKGFYLEVKNDTQGINIPQFDYSTQFGSSGKLQGTIDLGDVTTLAGNPFGPKLDETVTTLNHEMMHRFGAYVRFKNPDSTLNSALLGKDSAHWSYLLDSKGSLMYGNGWQDNGNGSFTATAAMSGFSPLDLYLMGMIEKSQVPPMVLIENGTIDKTKIPELGATIAGTARTVTIDDIIAAEGPRIPDAATSPKKFNVGFVLLTRPGVPTGNAPAAIETLRSAWAGRFAELTRGIGGINNVAPSLTMNIDSPADGATVTGPSVTVTGTVINSTGAETGVTVNGIPASISGSRFVANHVPLQEGANAIEIKATDANGLTSTMTRSVTAQAGHYLRIISNIDSGTGPLDASFRLDASFSITRSTIGISGPVEVSLNPGATPTEFTARFIVEGVYTVTARTVGPDGQTYSDLVTITVISRSQLETLLQGKWEGMKARLTAKDGNGALAYLITSAQADYRTGFQAYAEKLPLLAQDLPSIELVKATNVRATTLLLREENIKGVNKLIGYTVDFVKENGQWKLLNF